jgi:hypothetical protein
MRNHHRARVRDSVGPVGVMHDAAPDRPLTPARAGLAIRPTTIPLRQVAVDAISRNKVTLRRVATPGQGCGGMDLCGRPITSRLES